MACNWTRQQVKPEDILDAARTIPANNSRYTMNFTADWGEAREYLRWADDALQRGGDAGWDTAAGLAKRAVCRQMDGILMHNHLRRYLGNNYKVKAGYLAALKVPGLNLLRDLVIDPRNEIEHTYDRATENQARHACEFAELFLDATDKEASTPAIIALGWNVSYTAKQSTKPGDEYKIIEFSYKNSMNPMLLIDYHAPEPMVLVLRPEDATLSYCQLQLFSGDHVIKLNVMLRECLKSETGSTQPVSEWFMTNLKQQLNLYIITK